VLVNGEEISESEAFVSESECSTAWTDE
jgi:hypothetical protein